MKTIYSNYDLYVEEFDITKQELLEEYEEDEVTDEMVYDILNIIDRDSWEDTMAILDKACTNNVLCYGSAGRWNGRHTGWSVGSFDKVLADLIEDCDFVEISISDDNELTIEASHHDGTNYATIKNLSDEGYEFYDDWSYMGSDIDLNRQEMLEKLLSDFASDVVVEF